MRTNVTVASRIASDIARLEANKNYGSAWNELYRELFGEIAFAYPGVNQFRYQCANGRIVSCKEDAAQTWITAATK